MEPPTHYAMENGACTNIGHYFDNNHIRFRTQREGVWDDETAYPWIPAPHCQVPGRNPSGLSEFSGSSTLFCQPHDGPHSTSESWSHYVAPPTPAATGYSFHGNGNAMTPGLLATGSWLEAESSGWHSLYGNDKREMHSPSSAIGSLHEQQMYNEPLMQLSQSISPPEHEGYTVAHPNEYVSPDTCAFSSEPIEEQFSGPTPGKDVHKVLCPHGCGTSLTGTHAYGNLTRHQKSRVCKGSGRAKTRYHCQMQGCTRVYSRSDGLKVHMRRRHGAPLEGPKGEEICGEVGYRYVLGDTGSRW